MDLMRKVGLLGSSALRSVALIGAALSACSPALAQEATPEGDPAAATEDDPIARSGDAATVTQNPQEQDREQEAIVVTGSRIRQTEATSSSPLLIIDPVLAQRQGRFDTAEMVQNSPIANGSSQITSAISSNSLGTPGGPGSATVSLRGLGAERTLVLLNSRRAGPAGTRGAISSFDLNVLPSSIIRSVEILKDGASSIYGSDAIAGVVNIITKRDTDGVELNGFSSMPLESGGETYNISATWGKDFGRGHILVAGDYYKRHELEKRDRKYLDCAEDYLFRSDGRTRADLIDPRTGRPQCNGVVWGHVWAYGSSNLPDPDLTLLQYSYGNDNLGAYIPPLAPATQPGDLQVPAGWFPVGYLGSAAANGVTNLYHPFERKSSVIPETDRYTAYADAAFEITDGIELYAEGLFNRRRTHVDTLSQFYNFGYTDLFAPGDPEDPFPGFTSPLGGNAFISPTGILDDYDNTTTVNYYRGVGGLRGDIGSNWRFDVYGQYSLSKGKYQLQQILNDAIYQQTLRGYGYACEGVFTPVSNRACVQINWVDPRVMYGDLTQQEKDYLLDTEVGRTNYKQVFGEASLSGDLLQLPAGPLGVAFGAVVRRDQINDLPGHISRAANPDYDPVTAPDEPEFIDNAFANNFSAGHTFGHSITKEAFAEVNIPILRNSPFAESLTVSGAARVTNVKAVRGIDNFSSSNKGNWTYKIMANWQVTDWVRLRGTYGTSFRAPALYEQFLAEQFDRERQVDIDPCVRWGNALAQGTITQRIADNCAADGIPANHSGAGIQASIFTSGGIGELEPETSKSKTASIILTPKLAFLPDTDIALTVDYFDIRVKGEIAQFEASDILYGCYSADDFPDNPLCGLFERGQDGNPNNVRNVYERYININEQENSGVDFTLRLRHNLGRMGTFSLLSQVTYQRRDNITLFDGQTENLNGEVGDPKLTGDLNLTWERGGTSLFWGINYIGKASSEADFIEANGALCNFNPDTQDILGDYCYDRKVEAAVYHNVSATQRVGDKFEFTVGVSNLLDRAPPRISYISSTSLGNSPYVSQYDWLGRRVFVQAKARF
jgi:iron complex outermembrane receptor protein